jgi:hypothetical protein
MGVTPNSHLAPRFSVGCKESLTVRAVSIIMRLLHIIRF